MGDIKKLNVEEAQNKSAAEESKTTVDKKLSYEELENIAHQLSDQARSLYARVQQLESNALFQRLNYLFKVVDKSCTFSFPDDFVKKCAEEIIEILTIPEEEHESDNTKDSE